MLEDDVYARWGLWDQAAQHYLDLLTHDQPAHEQVRLAAALAGLCAFLCRYPLAVALLGQDALGTFNLHAPWYALLDGKVTGDATRVVFDAPLFDYERLDGVAAYRVACECLQRLPLLDAALQAGFTTLIMPRVAETVILGQVRADLLDATGADAALFRP